MTTTQPKTTAYQVFIGVLLILIAGLTYQTCRKKVDTEQQSINLINAMGDTIRIQRLKDSSERASITVLQLSNTKAFQEIFFRDSQVVALQVLANEYKDKLEVGSSVTIGKTTTVYRDTGSTVVIYPIPSDYDTIPYKQLIYPIYQRSNSNQWIAYNIRASKDTTILGLSVVNKYAVILGYNKKKPFVDVINYNPYSSTRILRSYQVLVPKEKRFGIGFSSGIGIGQGLKLSPYIGIGIQYSVIKF